MNTRLAFSLAVGLLPLCLASGANADEQVIVVEFSGPRAAKAQRGIEDLLEKTDTFTVTAAQRADVAANLVDVAREYGGDVVVSGSVKGTKLHLELWWSEGRAETFELALAASGAPSAAAKQRVSQRVVRRIKELARLRKGRATLALRSGGILGGVEGTPLRDQSLSAKTVTPQADVEAKAPAKPTGGPPKGPPVPNAMPTERRVVKATKKSGSIDLDGRLDEAAWAQAEVQEGLYNIWPDWGKKADEMTRFRVMYDDDALYVGVEAKSKDMSKVVSPLLRYDDNERIAASDWVLVGLDSTQSDRNSYLFRINPEGVRGELMIVDDNRHAYEWTGRWQGNAHKQKDGWTAEFKIPYSQIRFDRSNSQKWGLNVQRMYGTSVMQAWSLFPMQHVVSNYGDLDGLVGLNPKRPYSVTPYVLGGIHVIDADGADPLNDDVSPSWNVGTDFSAGLGGDFTLKGAVNPDFGHIEADPDEVNLTDRETFFAERRPLFEESVELFGFSLARENAGNERLFHTRRIGAPPRASGAALVSSGMATFFEEDIDTTVLGAAQLRGTLGGHKIAVLTALSGDEETTYIDAADESEQKALIEPLTNYNVLQIGRDFNQGRTSWRLLGTSMFRDGSQDDLLVPAHDTALAGGLQLRQRFAEVWEANLRGTGSYVGGSPAAIARTQRSSLRYFQRPDADHVEFDPELDRLYGMAVTGSVIRDVRWGWIPGIGFDARSPGFEVNDVGFLQDADLAVGWGRLKWGSELRTDAKLREISTSIDVAHVTDWAPENLRTESRLNGTIMTQGNWILNAYVGGAAIHLDRGALRGGPGMAGDLEGRSGINLASDRRRAVVLTTGVDTWYLPEANDSWSASGNIGLAWQASSGLNLGLTPSYTVRVDDRQCVTGGCFSPDMMMAPHFVVGRVEQKTLAAIMRVSYLLNTRLSIEGYLQPFLSSGEFSDYKEVVDPRNESYADRYRVFPDAELIPSGPTLGVDQNGDGTPEFSFPTGNFSQLNLRSNLVIRWEYRPDSFVTLVWSQSRAERTGETSRQLFDDYASSFTAPGEHAVFVKLSAWLGR